MEEAAFALNALKRRKDDKRRMFIANEFHDSMLCKAATWLNKAKKTNGGRLPQGKMLQVIQDCADHGVHVTQRVLNKLIVKNEPQQLGATTLPVIAVTVETQMSISSLGPDGVEDIDVTKKVSGHPKGSTKVNIDKENVLKRKCKTEIAIAYDKKKKK
jgi:hypothetical protein